VPEPALDPEPEPAEGTIEPAVTAVEAEPAAAPEEPTAPAKRTRKKSSEEVAS
jgi:hypothetical protein